ncbi:MAG TPA: exonuclease subunit SbcD [Planctomycetota bacterium]|nr:exonuclease subunit SbcD [Planctomycetota bacterium]
MKIVHTADWHIGKILYGQQRYQEYIDILEEFKEHLFQREVDVLLIAGDVYDYQNPSPDSKKLLYDFLYDISKRNIQTVIIAGNHDSENYFEALKNIMQLANVTIRGFVHPDITPTTLILEKNGQIVHFFLLPFISEKYFLQTQNFEKEDTHQQLYSKGVGKILNRIVEGKNPDHIYIVVSHILIHGAKVSGSEKRLYLGSNYAVHPSQVPDGIDYFALGHMHYQQKIEESLVPIYYAGSILQIDFAERETQKGYLFLDTEQDRPFVPEFVPLSKSKKLVSLKGTWQEIQQQTETLDKENTYFALDIQEQMNIPISQIQKELPNTLKIQQQPQVIPDVEIHHQAADWLPDMYRKYYQAQEKQQVLPQVLQEFQQLYTSCVRKK